MLVYLSYSIMDIYQPPLWVPPLLENKTAMENGFVFYNPIDTMADHFKNEAFVKHLSPERIPPLIKDNAKVFKLEPMLFESLPDEKTQPNPMTSTLMARFADADVGKSILNIVFSDLFVLMKADCLVVDMNQPSHGGKPMEVLYAHLWDIPIIGICHRRDFSPWIANLISCMISPRTTDDIVKAIGNYAKHS